MKLLFTLPLLTSCSVIKLSSVGPGFASIALVGALILFFFLVIKPNQDAKNERKRKAREEAESRRDREEAFLQTPSLRNYQQVRDYQDYFAETQLMGETL